MRFKIDEKLPIDIVADLRSAGHEADTVADQGLAGAEDSAIMAKVQSDGRVFFTSDKGIGDIRRYPPDQFAGIIIFRPRAMDPGSALSFVRRNLPILLLSDLAGHLFIVTDGGIRVR
jgi:predicted nuclease of predicted toxin-antitoxin system